MFRLPLASFGLSPDQALQLAGLLPLVAILYTAVRAAFREGLVPNQLVFTGIVAGLLLNTILPGGEGFIAAWPGGLGPGSSLLGMAAGAAAMRPFYAFGVLRGGDLKLMAVVGAFLGPADVVPAIFGTFLAGGALSLACSLRWRSPIRLTPSLASLLRHYLLSLSAPPAKMLAGTKPQPGLPYALAVALGTLGAVLWSRLSPL